MNFILSGSSVVSAKVADSTGDTAETMRFVKRAEALLAKCFRGRDGKKCSEFDFLSKSVRIGRQALRKETLIKKLQAELSTKSGQAKKTSTEVSKSGPALSGQCQYEDFRRERFGLYQIYDSGGLGYTKTPSNSEDGECFTTSEKTGKEYKVFFCQNGSFVNIQVESGNVSNPTKRQEDILFDRVDGKFCHIQTVHVKESKGDKVLTEVNLTRDECERVYNNHLSSVSQLSRGFVDVKPQDELQTLGLCLRYDIVPLPSANTTTIAPASPTSGVKSRK